MTGEYACEIVRWRYPEPYSLYDLAPEDFELLLDPDYHYHAALLDGELSGYFCVGRDAQVPGGDYLQEALDLGLGLHPDLVGRGYGLPFVEEIISFTREHHSPERLRLTVATFNRRAIRVYERAGFEWESVFEPASGIEFAQMMRGA